MERTNRRSGGRPEEALSRVRHKNPILCSPYLLLPLQLKAAVHASEVLVVSLKSP